MVTLGTGGRKSLRELGSSRHIGSHALLQPSRNRQRDRDPRPTAWLYRLPQSAQELLSLSSQPLDDLGHFLACKRLLATGPGRWTRQRFFGGP